MIFSFEIFSMGSEILMMLTVLYGIEMHLIVMGRKEVQLFNSSFFKGRRRLIFSLLLPVFIGPFRVAVFQIISQQRFLTLNGIIIQVWFTSVLMLVRIEANDRQ